MKTIFTIRTAVADLEAKIEKLRFVQDDSAVDISGGDFEVESKSQALTKDLYGS